LQFCERWLPGLRYVRLKWQDMAELECDQAAMQAGFSTEFIARTILKLQRMTQGYLLDEGLLSYVGDQDAGGLKLRLQSLILGPRDSIGASPVLLLVTIWVIGSLVFFIEIHHISETLLGWLT